MLSEDRETLGELVGHKSPDFLRREAKKALRSMG